MDIDESLLPDEVPPVFSAEHNQLLERVYRLDEGIVLWLYSGNRELKDAAMAIVDDEVKRIHGSADGAGASTWTGLPTICEAKREFDVDAPPVRMKWSVKRKPVPGPSGWEAARENAQRGQVIDEAVNDTHGHQSRPSVASTQLLQPTCENGVELDIGGPPVPSLQDASRISEPETRSSEAIEKSRSVRPASTPTAPYFQPPPPSKQHKFKHRYTTFLERHDLTASEYRAHLFLRDLKNRALQYPLTRTLHQACHKIKSSLQNYGDQYAHHWRTNPHPPAAFEHTPLVDYVLTHHSPSTLQTVRLMHQYRSSIPSHQMPVSDDALKLLVAVEEVYADCPRVVVQFRESVMALWVGEIELATFLRRVLRLFEGREEVLGAVRGYWGACWPPEVRCEEAIRRV